MTRAAPHVWTIGYEGHDPASLVEKLRKARIQRVVDIRELPLSRKKGFSKHGLALGLQAADMTYSHAKALGTPRVVRHAYKAGGGFGAFHNAYVAHLRKQEPAIQELVDVATRERCALLCVEKDVEACHRKILADELASRGWRVTHL